MTQEIQAAFEKFCDDYRLDFKVSEGINLYDFFKAGVDWYEDKLLNSFKPKLQEKPNMPEKMPDPNKANWYRTTNGPRYFDGSNWYRRGSDLIDIGDEMCIVGRPYEWREM